jgi:hypothetical protein
MLTEVIEVNRGQESVESRSEKMMAVAELACKGWGLSRGFRRCPGVYGNGFIDLGSPVSKQGRVRSGWCDGVPRNQRRSREGERKVDSNFHP